MIIHSNKDLVARIRNKNVCIVGPATSLVGTETGENIDKFDCIVRTNDAAFLDESTHRDYGSRTDIAYLNNAFIKRSIGVGVHDKAQRVKNLITLLTKFERRGVNFLVVKGEKTVKLFNSAIRAFCKVKERDVNLQVVLSARQFMDQKTKKLWSQTKGGMFEPTLASFIISDMVSLRPELLYVTGMDFYTNSDHWVGTYNEEVNQKREEVIRRKNHHILADIEYMQSVRDKCKYIKFDSILDHFLS